MNGFSPKVVLCNVSMIKPYHQNVKKHPQAQLEKIIKSIAEFGMDQPIVVDGNNTIIKGHGRFEAMIQMGLPQIPTIVRTDLSPSQVRAARIMDNKSAESEWDIDSLVLELSALGEEGFRLDLTGFDATELDDFFRTDFDDPDDGEPGDGIGGEIDTNQPQAECQCPKCGFVFVPKPTDVN